MMTLEDKAMYKRLQRQCQEAYEKHFDRGNGGRIPGIKPNLFNNRLERMKQFCIEKGLTESYWLKVKQL